MLAARGEVDQPGLAEALRDCVDDVVRMPVDRRVLAARAAVQLRSRRLSLQLADTVRRVEALSKDKDQLLGMVAHDLRSPLAAMAVALDMLSPAPSLDERQSLIIQVLRSSAEKMTHLLDDVLDAARIDRGEIRLVPVVQPLAPLVDAVTRHYAMVAAQKDIRVIFSDDAPGLEARIDRMRMEQVLTNLLTNALKFSHRGSTVTVGIARGANGSAHISVADHGVGIKAEHLPHMFREFARFGPPTGGEPSTGLGLAITHKLVAMHDGEIDVTSVYGQGTTFTVRLPPACTETHSRT